MVMTILAHRVVSTINGRTIPVFEADAQHGVDQPIGTGSITVPLPLPDSLRGPGEQILNAPINVQAGFENGRIRTIFSGRIDADRFTMDARTREATLNLIGNASLLDFEEETDLIFPGPVRLEEIIRSLCRWRRVPSVRIDRITYPDGATDVTLGTNKDIDEGEVIIPRRTSPLQWISRKLELFGYRIFDCPNGELRVQRVSGLPDEAPLASYVEGVNLYRLERRRDLSKMVTYWRIEGASYTDNDGVQMKIVSIPATVPPHPLLTPPGYRGARISDSDLVSQSLAHAARNVAEIDHAAPYLEASWETRGDPDRQPGDVIEARSETFDSAGKRWLMSIRQTVTNRDYTAQMTAWAGAGSPLLAGSDARTVAVATGPYHIGDEYLSHYAVPSPNSKTVRLSFVVPDEYTSIAISGLGHGCNSFLIDGANAESTVSKIEVWQGSGEEPVGSAELPVMPENLLERLNYRNIANWQRFRLPIPGRLEPGRAEIRIVSGEDKNGGPDDFEVRDIAVTLYGVGTPSLPRVGVS